jgi:hypothetical protein
MPGRQISDENTTTRRLIGIQPDSDLRGIRWSILDVILLPQLLRTQLNYAAMSSAASASSGLRPHLSNLNASVWPSSPGSESP